jgi:hypothetical protein
VKKKMKDLDMNRRAFVKNSTLAGAGIVAGTALPGAAFASATEENVEPSKQKGYQLTQHVIDYYKSAAS